MEQEETTFSVVSANAGNTKGEDSTLSMSTDVSLHSSSPDIDMMSIQSVKGNEEDHSHDLSSDGKYEL